MDGRKYSEAQAAPRHLVYSPYNPPTLPPLHPPTAGDGVSKDSPPGSKAVSPVSSSRVGTRYDSLGRPFPARLIPPSSAGASESDWERKCSSSTTSTVTSPTSAQDYIRPVKGYAPTDAPHGQSRWTSQPRQPRRVYSKSSRHESISLHRRLRAALREMFKCEPDDDKSFTRIRSKHWTEDDY